MMIISLTGRLGADPEVRTSDKGSVTTVRVATDTYARGEKRTTWVRAAIFGRRGETLAQHFRKGDPIFLSGPAYQDEYTAKDGTVRQAIEMTGAEFDFVGQAKDRQAPAQSKAPAPVEDDDDLPF